MTPESIIKQQSKKILSNELWARTVAAFVLVSTCLIICISCFELVNYLFEQLVYENDITTFSSLSLNDVLFLVIGNVLCIIISLFFSVIINGYMRFFYKAAKGQQPQISEVFHYFTSGKEFFFALNLNLRIILYNLGWALLFFLPTIAVIAVYLIFKGVVVQAQALVAINAVASLLLLSIVNAKYFLAEPLHVENSELSARQCLSESKRIMKNNSSKIIKLTFSFTPQFLLCLLLMPALYVFPLLATAQCVSSKWILESQKGEE